MIREDLVAERIGIEAYGEMIRYFGDDDPTSRRLLEEIVANEEEHAEDLTALADVLRRKEQISLTTSTLERRVSDARLAPTRSRGLVVDRPRRIDSAIDYFGAGEARRQELSGY